VLRIQNAVCGFWYHMPHRNELCTVHPETCDEVGRGGMWMVVLRILSGVVGHNSIHETSI
jgi:hypothetical protein